MTRDHLLKLPKCDIRTCNQPVRVYVDKTDQDLCDDHGDQWSDDEKIPIQVPETVHGSEQ